MKGRTKLFILAGLIILILLGLAGFGLFTALKPSPSQIQTKELEVKAIIPSKSGTPGDFITHVFQVTNRSANSGTYELEVTAPEGWKVVSMLSSLFLPSGASEKVFITLGVPYRTAAGRYSLVLKAISQDDPKMLVTASAAVKIERAARPKIRAAIEQKEAVAGEEASFLFSLTNLGNIVGSFVLEARSLHNWPLELSSKRTKLAPGEAKELTIKFQVPNNAPSGKEEIILKATTGKYSDEAKVTVSVLP